MYYKLLKPIVGRIMSTKVGLVKEFKPSMIDINLYHIYATKKQESESAQEV